MDSTLCMAEVALGVGGMREGLTPGMDALLRRIEAASSAPFHALSAQEARAQYERRAEVLDLPRAVIPEVLDLQLPMRDGAARRARLYRPQGPHASNSRPALLYFHGGGFTVGSLETHDSLCRQLALRSGADVMAFDYRLAPEHRFPQAVHDCEDALHHLVEEGAQWGIDADRLAVGGDSAGGTLAAVVALLARDHGWLLRLQLLITPGTAAMADSESHRRYAQGYLLDAQTIEWFFSHYISHPERSNWRFAPLLAQTHEGVASAAVLLAECDPLVDEGMAYADRLRWAGVPVDLHIGRGMVHDFIKMGRALKEAQQAQSWCAEQMRAALMD